MTIKNELVKYVIDKSDRTLDPMMVEDIILLDYCPNTGNFIWNKTINSHIQKGRIAGSIDKHGYICIGIKNKIIKAHRLAFLFMTGSFPKNQVDHIDQNRSNNIWNNLRDIKQKENTKNRKVDSRSISDYTGIRFIKKTNKFQARIYSNGKLIILGSFTNLKDAIDIKEKANIKYKFHKNHGG